MNDNDSEGRTADDRGGEPLVSRREWVGLMSAPVMTAAFGSALLDASAPPVSESWLAAASLARGADDASAAHRASAAASGQAADPAAGQAAAARADAGADARLAGARLFNVRDFGANGDAATLDTAAVQAAIDACHADRGGVVLVPAGDFLVGTLELKSHVTLRLATQGRLLGSGRPGDYSAGKGLPPGNGNQVLLYAANAENVTIEGRGTIDGQGAHFYNGQGDNSGPNAAPGGNTQRPHLLVFYRCTNLLLRDAFFTRSAYHCCRMLDCRHVRIDGIRIYNRVNKNNDGFHFQGSQHVAVSNCHVVCQDDACALFGSTQWVTVTNCVFSTRWSVFRFGRGEAENITVSNCVIYETYGCPIKIRASAGTRFENMIFANLVLRDVTGPISIGLDTNYGRKPGDTAPLTKGIVRNIAFRGIRATMVSAPRAHPDIPFELNAYPGETRTPIILNGVGDDQLEAISLSDVQVRFAGGGTRADAAIRDVPQIAGEYFQLGALPAYGLYARNVRGLTLDQVRFETVQPDARPAVVFEGVRDASLTGLSAQGQPDAEALLRFSETQDVLLTASRVLSPAAVFLQVDGPSSEAIAIDGGQIEKAARPLALTRGARANAVRLRR